MKVLITGAGGQVGSALAGSVPPHVQLIAVGHQDLDITDEAAVTSCLRAYTPDVVVNAAAHTAVDRAESEPELARRINTQGAEFLALAARETRARLVQLSTDFVFDGTASRPYRPDSPTHPLSVYGLTKRDAEQVVLATLGPRAVVLRTSWVYAAQGTNFVRTMLRLMAANPSVRVVADQVGTPTAAASVAQAVWRVIANPDMSGIHHWSDAGIASWYDLAVAVAEEGAQLGLLPAGVNVTPIATEDYPTPARRPAYSVLDKSSLVAAGIVPVHWRAQLRSVLGEMKCG